MSLRTEAASASPAGEVQTTEIGDLPTSWRVVALGELFDIQQGKAISPAARGGPTLRPFLRTANVLWGRLDLGQVDQMSFDEDEARRLELRPGDLLVCEGGEIGRTAIWNGEISGCLYQNHVHRLRATSPDVVPAFVMHWLRAGFTQLGLYGGVGNKTTIPNLSAGRLRHLPVALPPVDEQRRIAEFLAAAYAAVLATERRYRQLDRLFASLLVELMMGRLGSTPRASGTE